MMLKNGLEAMKDRGRLTITTFLNNDQVALTVEDEGCGIVEEDIENGTGLGLATCFCIAEHNAKIDILV